MQEIRYKIDLNENGRPCIDLPPDYVHNQEDKFFALEITRYYLQVVFARMDRSLYDENTMKRFDDNIQFLGQMGDEMAEIIFDDMIKNGDIAMAMNEGEFNAHIYQKSIADRDALSFTYIIYGNKIFKREIGLKVFVHDGESPEPYDDINGIYELVGGITNEHWVKIQ